MKTPINCRLMDLLVLLMLLLGVAACGQAKKKSQNPPGYDLAHPQKFILPDGLLEISGITFNGGNADTLLAEQDEKGRVYRLHPGDKVVKHSEFGKNGDFEDITLMNGRVFMLRSDGTLFSFVFNPAWPEKITGVREFKKLAPGGEYEGLYGDGKTGRLYMLCKECGHSKGEAVVQGSVFNVDAAGNVSPAGTFSAELSGFPGIPRHKKFHFRPSALTRHPKNGDWYILSSVNKMLVVASGNFTVKGVYPLDPSVFRQPEGITFDRNLNLYISNEGDSGNSANLLKFKLLR